MQPSDSHLDCVQNLRVPSQVFLHGLFFFFLFKQTRQWCENTTSKYMLKPAFDLYLAWLSYTVVPLKNSLSPADIVLLNTFMNTWILLLGNWPLKSLETCGCMKRNIKHTEELRIIWDSQCCCYFVTVTVLTMSKSSCKQCLTRDNCPSHQGQNKSSKEATDTKGSVTFFSSWKRQWAGCSAWEDVRQRGDSAHPDGCALQLDTTAADRLMSVWTRFLRREQEYFHGVIDNQ